MTDPHLVHVGTTEVMAARLFGEDDVPEWLPADDANGALHVRRWGDNHVMIDLTVGVRGERHAVCVTISGLYVVDEDLFERPQDEQNDFARRQMADLLPFLRQAVYNASSQVWPVKPILLDGREEATKVHERTS